MAGVALFGSTCSDRGFMLLKPTKNVLVIDNFTRVCIFVYCSSMNRTTAVAHGHAGRSARTSFLEVKLHAMH